MLLISQLDGLSTFCVKHKLFINMYTAARYFLLSAAKGIHFTLCHCVILLLQGAFSITLPSRLSVFEYFLSLRLSHQTVCYLLSRACYE